MSIFNTPKKIAVKIVDVVSPSCGQNMRKMAKRPEENAALNRRLDQVEDEVRDLRNVVETLNRDLDESRRLNLRAAELFDIAFTQLAK